jgi:hypothetical protein
MGKNRDLILLLIIVIIGMFIPFFSSIIIMNKLDITDINNWLKLGQNFGLFLLIFSIELIAVYLYFSITNRLAQKKIDKQTFPKNK